MRVDRVDGRQDLHRFVTFPWQVYRGDPNWVPPLIGGAKKMLTQHPFLKHADVDYYLARRGGQVVGRIAYILNHLHNQEHSERTAFFGFFEVLPEPGPPSSAATSSSSEPTTSTASASEPTSHGASSSDTEIATALLLQVQERARQAGMTVLRGPANFSSNEEWSLLIDGFDMPPAVMMTYNPPRYMTLLEGFGFTKAKDLVAYYLDNVDPPERIVRVAEKMAARKGVIVRPINKKRFAEDVGKIRIVYNKAWEKNWGFVPLTGAEIEHMAKELKPLVKPDLFLIAEKGDEPVGFALALPDFNAAVRHANGRLFPLGLLKILWHARRIDMLRVLTLGLIPEYRRTGIDQLFYLRLFQGGKRHGIKRGELSWILEDNVSMRQALEKFGCRVYKTYRVYEKVIA
ncbi:MAG: N-acetyltransferase [Candidatus Eisenbacteria sp.]|nr:N-acetyltransferase [Candidatus Eisenbacteria bacterium]